MQRAKHDLESVDAYGMLVRNSLKQLHIVLIMGKEKPIQMSVLFQLQMCMHLCLF